MIQVETSTDKVIHKVTIKHPKEIELISRESDNKLFVRFHNPTMMGLPNSQLAQLTKLDVINNIPSGFVAITTEFEGEVTTELPANYPHEIVGFTEVVNGLPNKVAYYIEL